MNIWELIIQQPFINILIVMTDYLADNFGLAIIALTIIINLAMLPLTLKQIRSTKAMQDLQPKIAEITKKYARDKQKLAQEQMKLYKESGVKPAGCAITMIIQMPVWLALYQSIMLALAVAPEGLLNLSKYLYPWPTVYSMVPLNREFLGLSLADPNIIFAVLVGATMWIQQKMTTTTMSSDPRQAQQAQMMLWMMPMMFGLLALSFPLGLSLYWVTSSLARIAMQYKISGWGGLKRQPKPVLQEQRKGVKLDAVPDKTIEEKPARNIVVRDMLPPQIPKPSKTRYQPGKDRTQHKKK